MKEREARRKAEAQGAVQNDPAVTTRRARAGAGAGASAHAGRDDAAPRPGRAGGRRRDLKPFETGIDYKPTSPGTPVTFNLEDASLTDLVRLISQITGKRFILPSTTRAIKATVYAPTKVTAAEAYQAFLSILELNGMALVPAGRYLKIVESGRVEGRADPALHAGRRRPDGRPLRDAPATRQQHLRRRRRAAARALQVRRRQHHGLRADQHADHHGHRQQHPAHAAHPRRRSTSRTPVSRSGSSRCTTRTRPSSRRG